MTTKGPSHKQVIIPMGSNNPDRVMAHSCNDLKLELRLHLGKDLRKYKGWIEVVKRKDTGVYLRYIYVTRECPWRVHEAVYMRMYQGENED